MRIPLCLPCSVQLLEGNLSAETFNVSYSGLGVVLAPEYPGFTWKALQSVSVQGLGDFDVAVKWRRGNRLGLRFCSKTTARPVLNAYFMQTGNYPV
ncbi:PilZ domain-containing protein [Parasedimentitalea psychrophila]